MILIDFSRCWREGAYLFTAATFKKGFQGTTHQLSWRGLNQRRVTYMIDNLSTPTANILQTPNK